MLDKFVARPFGQEVARRCSMRHLGDLPPGTKLVVIFGLGNGGNYVREARKHCAFEIGTQVRQNGLAEEAMSLFVTSQNTHSVLEYDEKTGAFIKVAASGLGDPIGVVVGLDGNLLVSDGQGNEVNRYDKTNGAFIDVFASTNLAAPVGMTIHQGALYVVNAHAPFGVQRFDAVTGVNTGQFAASLVAGNPFPDPKDVKVNPANNRLYLVYRGAATVETFDLTTMASFGLLWPANDPSASGGLAIPTSLAFGPDGNLYISGGAMGNFGVRRYNPTTGAFIDFFAPTGPDAPIGIAFGPDNDLYIATQSGGSKVLRFNYPSGTFMNVFVPAGSGGLQAPYHLVFGAVRALTFTLLQDCLNDVNDVGMRWQIEGGRVLVDGNHVADYYSVKRVSCGTTNQNTAQLWFTLFYIGKKPPENITLHGAHDIQGGGEIGSVSAASSAFSLYIGKQFKRVANTLTIG